MVNWINILNLYDAMMVSAVSAKTHPSQAFASANALTCWCGGGHPKCKGLNPIPHPSQDFASSYNILWWHGKRHF